MKMDSWQANKFRLEELMPLILEQLAEGKTVRFSPRGTSMLPMLRQGMDDVVLSPVPERLHKYDLPLYQRGNGQFVLHRIVGTGETYTCLGDNQFEREAGVKPEQILALVTKFYRNGTPHSVREPGYQLYCRLWHYSRPARRFWGWLRRHLR